MSDVNKVFLTGRITTDIKAGCTDKGIPVCNFVVACNEQNFTPSGEKKEDTCFQRIVVWRKLAEQCSGLGKGSLVFIEGKIKTREWIKGGVKQSINEVIAKEVKFLDCKKIKKSLEKC